jgi:hypothetical protein
MALGTESFAKSLTRAMVLKLRQRIDNSSFFEQQLELQTQRIQFPPSGFHGH